MECNTSRDLKIRFGEHYRRLKKLKRFDNFLYQHFERTGHLPNKVSVQPVEIMTYDEKSQDLKSLTHICPMDFSILMEWTNPFTILGVSGELFHFYWISNR